MFRSGIHATIAGVAMGLLMRVRKTEAEQLSPCDNAEVTLRPFSAGFAVPVFAFLAAGKRGETYIPIVAAARVTDVAEVLIGGRAVPISFTGIRPGEKIHEIMISEDECYRTTQRGNYYVIGPVLPELRSEPEEGASTPALQSEYSSSVVTLDHAGLRQLLAPHTRVEPGAEVPA